MITLWKIEPHFDEKHQDRYLVSIKGDKEDVYRVVIKFDEICQSPFPLKAQHSDYNWGFFMNTSSKEDRTELERYLKKHTADSPEEAKEKEGKRKEAGERVEHLAREIGGVIKDLTVNGISQEEAQQAFKHKDVVLPGEIKIPEGETSTEPIPREVGKIKPMYLQEEQELPEAGPLPVENTVRVGIMYPIGEKDKADIFMNGLTDVLKAVTRHPFTLEKVFDDNFIAEEKLNLSYVLEIYNEYKLEALLVFIPHYRVLPEAKNLSAALKKLPKKRKVLIRAIPLSKIASRATFVDLVVDIALFKGRGIGDFQN